MFSEGYFILFEWLMRGQTPGKKALKIRVIRDDGTPVTIHEVLVRNILRLIDFLPVALWGGRDRDVSPAGYPSGWAISRRAPSSSKRDNSTTAPMPIRSMNCGPVAIEEINAELTAAERRLVTGFLQRRHELLPKAREELAERLARPLYEKYGGGYYDAESYLVRLAKGRHHES